jgi:hypothetical protein
MLATEPTANEHFDDNHFGACPECRSAEHVKCCNIRRVHFMFCEIHRVAWCVGSNLFSSWENESEGDWQRNHAMLEGYQTVEPLMCYCDLCSRPVSSCEPFVGELPF